MNKSLPYLVCVILFLFIAKITLAQVAINTDGSSPNPSAMLDIKSTDGGILIPRITITQRDSIDSPATGLLVFVTDNNSFYFYNGTEWQSIIGSAGNSLDAADGDPVNAVYVDNDGNVGIGTTTPGAALDINGPIWQTGTGNSVFLGDSAGVNDDLTDNRNVFIGYNAGMSNTSGYGNIANGNFSLYSNTTGDVNTANGNESLTLNTSGSFNIANGYAALYSNTTGNGNVANGSYSLESNTTGFLNTANGSTSLRSNTIGSSNTAFGDATLHANTSGDKNIALGSWAGYNVTTGSNNILIGYRVYAPTGSESNQMSIGNIIFATDVDGVEHTISSGNVGIGTKNPSQKLSVAGIIESTTGGFQFPDGTIQTTAANNNLSVVWPGPSVVITGLWQQIISIDLPDAGTYRVFYSVRGEGESGSWLTARLFNNQTGSSVPNSEAIIAYVTNGNILMQTTASSESFITVSSPATIQLQVNRTGTSLLNVLSDEAGRTKMTFVRLTD